MWRNRLDWWQSSSSEVVPYSPKRAGVRLGVMGASSLLPGVQIFTALNQKNDKCMNYLFIINGDNMVQGHPVDSHRCEEPRKTSTEMSNCG